MSSPVPYTPFLKGFEIVFMCMGQGDCTMVRCPDGEIILIDCGSSADWDEDRRAKAVLALRKYCTDRPIHSLILTHPDKDHYNKIASVVGAVAFAEDVDVEMDGKDVKLKLDPKPISIKNVYFSDNVYANAFQTGGKTFTDYAGSLDKGPLRQYTVGAANDYVYGALIGPKSLNLVHLDGSKDAHIRTWAWDNSKKTNVATQRKPSGTLDTSPVEIVHRGGDKTIWSVSILVGNVLKNGDDKSDTDGCNAASLVTLLQWGDQKCLICGDATVSSEKVLLAGFKKAVRDVGFIQVPHHGSSLTSSSDAFVTAANANHVVMSVARFEKTFHLPGLSVVQSYLKNAESIEPESVMLVAGWFRCDNFVKGIGDTSAYQLQDKLIAMGIVPSGSLYILSDEQIATEAANAKGKPVAVGVTAATGYILYVQQTTKWVCQTGLEGWNIFFTFSMSS